MSTAVSTAHEWSAAGRSDQWARVAQPSQQVALICSCRRRSAMGRPQRSQTPYWPCAARASAYCARRRSSRSIGASAARSESRAEAGVAPCATCVFAAACSASSSHIASSSATCSRSSRRNAWASPTRRCCCAPTGRRMALSIFVGWPMFATIPRCRPSRTDPLVETPALRPARRCVHPVAPSDPPDSDALMPSLHSSSVGDEQTLIRRARPPTTTIPAPVRADAPIARHACM